MILASYKSFLYEDVFACVKAFVPKHFDVCVISSGLFDDELNKIAAENALVGHLCFGVITEAMKEYYLTHREVFRCPK